MAENGYFETLIKPFRAPEMQRHVVFTASGFSYNSNNLGFIYTQTSKNRYKIQAIYAGKYEDYSFTSKRDAIQFAVKLVQLDRAGKLRQ